MSELETVAVIGVGLIGGSIGLALRRRGIARRVVGVGRRRESLDVARDCGAVTETTTDLAAGVSEADAVVVCTPVEAIAGHVLDASRHAPPGALITDAGSVKESIVLAVQAGGGAAGFVGSHPLAGSEKAGPQHASADLFEGRIVIVAPADGAADSLTQRAERFWRLLGARTARMSPSAHDEAVASISHAPHLVAAALAAATPAEHLPLASTGFADTTRVAGGDVELWRQIVAANRRHTQAALDNFAAVLAELQAALRNGDDRALCEILQNGKRNRDAVEPDRSSKRARKG